MTDTHAGTFSSPIHKWPMYLLWPSLVGLALIALLVRYHAVMDIYETSILIGTAIVLGTMGWYWRALIPFYLLCATLVFISLILYDGALSRAEQNFGLKYLLSSQSAIMWMSSLYVLAMTCYLTDLLRPSSFISHTASKLTWAATVMGVSGLAIRWYESYLIDPQIGHIPISNLYEVFILFCLITALIYLYYEQRYKVARLGFFATLIIASAVGFLLWYTFERQAHIIQPLVPALNSYWMKLHVPANFVGYGCFALSAMIAIAWLITNRIGTKHPQSVWLHRLPSKVLIEDIMYKSIALGFAFFTIATVLGAVWAAEAWGGYWSWDPKETWALIVWLNYAAWLHFRLSKGLRGTVMAWWAIIGLGITLFAFIGVNMFLSGLHSYGEL